MSAPTMDDEAGPEDVGDSPVRTRHVARWVAVVVGIVLVAFVVVLATRHSADEGGPSSQLVARAVPEFSGQTIQGETFDIDALKGKWVVVNFFASWCIPCRVEHPELVAFAKQHEADSDVAVVSVAFEDEPGAVQAFFAKQGGDWPVIVGDTGRIALDFGVTGVPESYVVSPDGVIVARFVGITAAELNKAIGASPDSSDPTP